MISFSNYGFALSIFEQWNGLCAFFVLFQFSNDNSMDRLRWLYQNEGKVSVGECSQLIETLSGHLSEGGENLFKNTVENVFKSKIREIWTLSL